MDNLPVEVVMRIITETVSLERKDRAEYKNQLRNLTLTCSLWTSIVNGTPAIWSRIDWDDGQAFVEAALRKSRNHTLKIYYNYASEYEEDSEYGVWFMQTIAENSYRWWDNPAETLITASAPMLRSFRITHTLEYHGYGNQTQLFNGPMLLLKSLTIGHFDYWLDPRALTVLEYLNITFDYMDSDWMPFEDHAISADIPAAILRNNPNLCQVFLEGVRPEREDDGWDDFEPDNWDPIDLPQLQTMKLTNITMPYVRAIVPFLLFPNNQTFSLKVLDNEEFRLVLPLNWSSFGTRDDTTVLIEIKKSDMAVSLCGIQREDIIVDYCYDLHMKEQDDDSDDGLDSLGNGYPNLERISAFLGSLSPTARAACGYA